MAGHENQVTLLSLVREEAMEAGKLPSYTEQVMYVTAISVM
jgi:hypothetical protein